MEPRGTDLEPSLHLVARAAVRAGLAESDERVRVSRHGSGLFTVYRAESESGVLAVKVEPTDVCRAEVDGLEALQTAGAPVPTVRAVVEEGRLAAFAMDFIEEGRQSGGRESLLAGLLQLYQTPREAWGWPRNNFIGSLPQPNQVRHSFQEHWWEDRIRPQVERAVTARKISESTTARLETIIERRCKDWELDRVQPRLIHGDLWTGNVMFGRNGAVLIDPAVACGHPEQDFAMLELFGTPIAGASLDALAGQIGLGPARKKRVPFFQIYPLLVHVNLFGSGYTAQLESAMRACE